MTKNTVIIALLLAAITSFFYACTEDSDVGVGVLPEDALLEHLITDTFTLYTYTEKIDTVSGSGVGKLLLGKMTDPVFGITEASAAVQITLGTFNNFNDSLVADSVYLNLSYRDDGQRAYGDSTVYQTVNVYRMRENIKYDTIYNSNLDPNDFHQGELLGTADFRTDANPDSILRIRLDDSWGDFFIHPENPELFEYGDDFRELFNGFVLQTEAGNENASVVSLSLNSYSEMIVYYHWPSDPDSAREAGYPITQYCGRINMFTHDYTGTPVEDALNNTSNSEYVFVQGMGGLRMRLEMPFIEKLNELGTVAVYKAELLVETADDEGFLEDQYPSVPAMIVTGINEDGSYYALPEYSAESGYQSENLSELRQYRFDLAGYIQKVLQGAWPNNGLYIYGAADSQNFYRAVLRGAENQSPIRLIITYSIL